MAYLGNAKTPLIYAANVRDDIVPDAVTTTFTLSQEVPGAYESNVTVLRRKYLIDTILGATSLLSITGSTKTISCSNAAAASALSIIQPPITNIWPGDKVVISGASNSANNGTFPVSTVTYDGATISIVVTSPNPMVTESGGTITLKRGSTGPWELLEPEIDYSIGGPSGPTYNRLITFTQVPQIDDVLYVLHRGDATYNFVPSANSVGPDQLSTNLRNFVIDRYTANGSTTAFALTQFCVKAQALVVTDNGTVIDGDDPDTAYTGGGWTLDSNGLGITFKIAPTNTHKIRIAHLGFSTISRRAALSPGQVGAVAAGSIGTTQLGNAAVDASKLADGSVTKTKIASDAVDGTKTLLLNNDPIKGIKFAGGNQNLIKITTSDETLIDGLSDIIFARAGTTKVKITSTDIVPNGSISVGTSGSKFLDANFSGTITGANLVATAGANVTGNIVVSGNVDGVDVSVLNTTVSSINSAILPSYFAAGSIVMTGRSTAPPDLRYEGGIQTPVSALSWLLCDGTAYSRTTYVTLFNAIGTTYGVGNGSTTFNVPDFRQRFGLGKAASGTGATLGVSGGSIDHAHTGAAHTHDLGNHIHTGGTHTHSMDHTHTVVDHMHGMKNHVHTVYGHQHDCSSIYASVGAVNAAGNIGFKTDLSGFGISIGGNFYTYTSAGVPSIFPGAAPAGMIPTKLIGSSGGAPLTNVSSPFSSSPPDDNITNPAGAQTTSSASPTITVTGGAVATSTPSVNVTSSSGASATTTNNPPYLVVNYIIKT